jgi:hypothetical protein
MIAGRERREVPVNLLTSPYWMTSSARPSSDGGIVRPRAFMVRSLAE